VKGNSEAFLFCETVGTDTVLYSVTIIRSNYWISCVYSYKIGSYWKLDQYDPIF